MADLFEKIGKYLADLRYPENWIIADGAIAILMILLVVADRILALLDVSGLRQLEVIGIVVAASIILWFAARHLYWRWGTGRKIGVCYDGYKIPMDDWVETRRQLSKLVKHHLPSERIHLKLIPKSMVSSEKRWIKVEKRFGFSLLLIVNSSPRLDDPTKPESKFTLRGTLGNNIAKDFLASAAAHLAAIGSAQAQLTNLKELLDFHASTLFDQVLFLFGLGDFTRNQFVSASVFLKKLDERLTSRWTNTVNPRMAIRWMDCQCFSSHSVWPGNTPPGPEEIIKATNECKRAVELYGAEFPYLYNVLARDQFYMRDVAGALKSTELAITHNVDPVNRFNSILNRAVLNLFSENWQASASAFAEVFASEQIWNQNWADLIGFADFAYDYQYEHAILMRCLYRKIGGVPRPVDLDRKLAKWFEADKTRAPLHVLYTGGLPMRQLPKARRINAAARASAKRKPHKKKRSR